MNLRPLPVPPDQPRYARSLSSNQARFFLAAAFCGGFLTALAVPGPSIHPAAARSASAALAQASSPALAPTVIDPQAPVRAGSRIVWLPGVASPEGEADCDLDLVVQNLGHEANKATIIVWGDRGGCPPQAKGPLKVECSGLISPGSTWRFSSAQVPAGTGSLVVLSFSALRLSQIGVDLGFDDIVADYMCETLFFGVVGDSDDYRRFFDAYRGGSAFAGVPLERAAGAPIAVRLQRDCPPPEDASRPRTSTVVGTFDAELGVAGADGFFHYALPLAHASPVTRTGTALHIQNAGAECASVEVTFRAEDKPDAEPCALSVPVLASGEAAHMDLSACAVDGAARGSLILRGSQPLAVSSDLRWGESMFSFPGQTYLPDGDDGAPSAGVRSTELFAPVVYYDVGGWNSRVYVQNTDSAAAATVRVEVRWRAGVVDDADFSVELPPSGSRMIDLGAEIAGLGLPPNWVGSLRFTSESASGGDADAPQIAVVVAALRNLGEDGPSEAMGYVPATMPPMATGPDRNATQGGLLAIPSLTKASRFGATTELAIANGAVGAGATNLAVFLFDANGFLDYVCQRLGPQSVEHIDFATWGMINNGFRGSAVVSAMSWAHEAPEGDMDGRSSAHLSAVVTTRPSWTVGESTQDEAGDTSSMHEAVSIPQSAAARFVPGAIVSRFEVCGQAIVVQTPTPWPNGTPTPPPTRPAPTEMPTDPRAHRAYLPLLYR